MKPSRAPRHTGCIFNLAMIFLYALGGLWLTSMAFMLATYCREFPADWRNRRAGITRRPFVLPKPEHTATTAPFPIPGSLELRNAA